MRIHTLLKLFVVVALFALAALPAYAGTWVYSGGDRFYCGPTGCVGVDKVYSTYHTYRSPSTRYDYYRNYRGDVDIDIDIDIDIDCDRYNCRTYSRPYTYRPTYYTTNTMYVRGAEYTYPYNHRVVRTGYPYYTTTRYPYW